MAAAELPVARGPGLRVYASATSVPGTLVVYIEHEVQLVVMDERAREKLKRKERRRPREEHREPISRRAGRSQAPLNFDRPEMTKPGSR